ncbi:MAG: M23 family metallopeptidase [Bacillota bacterium]|nr:M23 family metallopeptidase [Bacillota bacterium]
MYPFKSYTITCEYGKKGSWACGYHTGTDFVGSDDNVLAIASGTVSTAAFDKSYGNYVVVHHDDGTASRYAHLVRSNVKKDDRVTEGQIIGIQGSTGNSTGKHLHLEVYGKLPVVYPIPFPGNTINPIGYLEEHNMGYKKISNYLYEVVSPTASTFPQEWEKAKRTTAIKNYCNFMFYTPLASPDPKFGKYYPVGNFAIDGKVINQAKDFPDWIDIAKLSTIDRKLSTFYVTKDQEAFYDELNQIDNIENLLWAASGIPVIKNGKEVSASRDIYPQGWRDDKFRCTWHTMLAFKYDKAYIFAFYNRKSGAAAATTEIYNTFKDYGFNYMIMYDGGTPFVFDVNGTNVAVTDGNAVVDTILRYNI